MVHLSLSLMGPFQAWTARGSLQSFRTLKERGLLAYLAVEQGHLHARDKLAELFWPERPEGAARNNLRQALFGLHQVIGEAGFDAIFTVTPEAVQFNLNDQVWLDVAAFDVHFKAAQMHDHLQNQPCFHCIEHLANAVELYRGDFLQDVFLDKNQEFQEWQAVCREQLFQRQIQALEYLVTAYDQMGEYGQAVVYANRQVQLDDLRENLYRRLMQLLVKTGNYGAAIEQYEICKRKLNEVLGIGLDQKTEQLAEEIRSGTFASFPSPRSPVIHNLPEQLTPFIGREMELARIAQYFERPGIRLLTVTGLGGAGKTRFAIQASLLNLRCFPDGIFFTPLEVVHSPEQLVEAIGNALGLVAGRQPNFKAVLLEHLRPQRLLLLLDSFEHLLDGKDLLLDILQAAPGVKILVTSRERLHFQAEQVIPLQGLSITVSEVEEADAGDTIQEPLHFEGPENHELHRFEAVQLFWERASRVCDALENNVDTDEPRHLGTSEAWRLLKPEDAEAIVRVCRAVDGLPLAIELAASWARDFSFTQIADEVQHSLDFLQASLQDLPERHRSLRASFEHSWDLLTENERDVFCRLAVFPGSFSVPAAQAVAGAALPWLIALEDKSLVRRVGLGRYGQHALLRQFAGLKLIQHSRRVEDQVRHQHAFFFCAFLRERETDLKGLRQAKALDEVKAEMENIRAAWDWAVKNRSLQLFEMAGFSLLLSMEILSRWNEGEAFFARAVECLEQETLDEHGKTILAYMMAFHGWFCCRLTRFDQAMASLQPSLQLLENSRDTNEKAFAYFAFGFLNTWMTRFEAAWVHLSASLAISQRIENHWGVAWTRQCLSEMAFESGKTGLEEGAFLETLFLFERLGETRGSSRALNYLGNIAVAKEHFERARGYFEKMTTHLEKIGDVWGAAGGYEKLGQVAASLGDFTRAQSLVQLSLQVLQKTGDQRRTAIVMGELGELAARLEDYAGTEHYFQEALEIASRTRYLPLAQDLLARVASALTCFHQPDRAVQLLQTALAHSWGDPLTMKRATQLLEQLQKQQQGGSSGQVAHQPVEACNLEDSQARIWGEVQELLNNGLHGLQLF